MFLRTHSTNEWTCEVIEEQKIKEMKHKINLIIAYWSSKKWIKFNAEEQKKMKKKKTVHTHRGRDQRKNWTTMKKSKTPHSVHKTDTKNQITQTFILHFVKNTQCTMNDREHGIKILLSTRNNDQRNFKYANALAKKKIYTKYYILYSRTIYKINWIRITLCDADRNHNVNDRTDESEHTNNRKAFKKKEARRNKKKVTVCIYTTIVMKMSTLVCAMFYLWYPCIA